MKEVQQFIIKYDSRYFLYYYSEKEDDSSELNLLYTGICQYISTYNISGILPPINGYRVGSRKLKLMFKNVGNSLGFLKLSLITILILKIYR